MNIAPEFPGVSQPGIVLQPPRHSRLYWAVADALVIAKRDLMHIPRVPEQLFDVTLQPIMFVLLFRYVFGGAIATGNTSYINFLIPGILVQAFVFGSMRTGLGLAEDLQRGVIDRFRSLPMARSAVLSGRTMADQARNVLGAIVMLAVGFAVGFRPSGSLLGWIGALALIFAFSFAFCWLGAILGLVARSSEGVQAVGFTLLFPLTFASSVFVPTNTMPSWLQTFTANQPVSVVVNGVRSLLLGAPDSSVVWQGFGWSLALLVIACPIAIWLYPRRTTR
jgi:ABC transporter DrrB family efflux protein